MRGGFRAEPSRRLRAAGLSGAYVRCAFLRDEFTLIGEADGWVRMPLARISRLRIGCRQSPFGPQYEARVWRVDASRALVLRLGGRGLRRSRCGAEG